MRLIDVDEFIQTVKILRDSYKSRGDGKAVLVTDNVLLNISLMPTVDAVPVVHGKWLETDAAPHRVCCSKCYKTFVNNKNWLKSNGGSIDNAEYCPHCHAKMDEVSE